MGAFTVLSGTDPDSAGLILQASIVALANAQSILAIDTELERRAANN